MDLVKGHHNLKTNLKVGPALTSLEGALQRALLLVLGRSTQLLRGVPNLRSTAKFKEVINKILNVGR